MHRIGTTWLIPIFTGIVGVAIGAHTSFPTFTIAPDRTSSTPPDVQFNSDTQSSIVDPVCSLDRTAATGASEDTEHSLDAGSVAQHTISNTPFDDKAAADTAFREATIIVQAALSRGEWTVDDGNRLRVQYRALPDDKRTELLSALVLAVNRGELAPTSPRFPF